MNTEDTKHDLETVLNELQTCIDELEILNYMKRLCQIITKSWKSEYANLILTKPLVYRFSAILALDNKLTKNLSISFLNNLFYELDFIKPFIMT
mmetsp:Transcript_16945/g.14878  ORF Transcript_16945/g.14878 Transcript_16945/m.14878 type:complete len:94 (-) Transcript_16945:190-471(-)